MRARQHALKRFEIEPILGDAGSPAIGGVEFFEPSGGALRFAKRLVAIALGVDQRLGRAGLRLA